ncbi:MAG: HEAT repeat domain-containing protein [Planctomycetes bacterium]|nr:HEAT repeat domain-containing protein [Planctomycetota bacterium]
MWSYYWYLGKRLLVLLVLIGAGIWAYYHYVVGLEGLTVEQLLRKHREGSSADAQVARIHLLRKADMAHADEFLRHAEHLNPMTREAVAEALGNIREEKVVDPLLKLLADANDNVRFMAIQSCGRHGSPYFVKPLIDRLTVEEEERFKSQIGSSLQDLTGENFMGHHEKWLNWYSMNKHKYKAKR